MEILIHIAVASLLMGISLVIACAGLFIIGALFNSSILVKIAEKGSVTGYVLLFSSIIIGTIQMCLQIITP